MAKTLSYINTSRKKTPVSESTQVPRPGVPYPSYSSGITATETINRIMPLIADLNAHMISLLVRDCYLYNPGFSDGAKGWSASDSEKVSITESNGNMVVRLTGTGRIFQSNGLIRKPSKRKEYLYGQDKEPDIQEPETVSDTIHTETVEWEPLEDPERKEGSEEKDTVLYLSIGYVCKDAGTLHAGFVGSDESAEGSLKMQSVQTVVSEDVQHINAQGTWDGNGGFHVYLDGGEVEVRYVFLLDNPLEEYRKQTDSHLAQIEENIGIMFDSLNAGIQRIKLIQDYINQLFVNDATINGSIGAIQEDISNLRTSVSTISASIGSIENYLTKLNERISALEDSISEPDEGA